VCHFLYLRQKSSYTPHRRSMATIGSANRSGHRPAS
jgi:hypothetical protein